ncbi:MAG TPA: phosphonatase-like hydrolase [Acidimicrobiales bacterium]|nr:phosphonatase-like hydrolase [Acidimicrobiales bacterium]
MIGPFALAVLDMAGTTVRDDGAVDEAFTSALTTVGIDPASARFEQARLYVLDTMGQSKADVFAALLGPDEAVRATEAFAVAYENIVAEGRIEPMAGAVETFAELRRRGVRVCLTTGFAPSTRQALIEALGWWDLIDLALSPADCGRGRPEPDMIFGAMERLGVTDAAAVVVVGDTTSDLEAGSRAGAGAVIGVLSGAHDEETLLAAPHTDLIGGISELIGVLSRS